MVMATHPPATPADASAAPMDDHDALPPGTRFGELEILRVLGVGGFGIVYLAQDHALERKVALKEYMPSSLAGRGKGMMVSIRSGAHTETYALGLRSFVNEARLLARFNHPSLVKVYRFWEENGTAYMVMPYLEGRTLREVRRAMSAPPSEGWIRSVIDPLLDALDTLHREDVYHRDIAPDNIVLPPGQAPVLLDFGAARRAIGDSTQTFTAILKPSYAPIEQYAEVVQLRQGPWTDFYALGAVVYYLLRGTPPPPATARAVQDDVLLMRPEDNPGMSAPFLAAMEWALAVRPSNRPASVAALREVLEGRATVPPPVPSGTTVIERTVVTPKPAAAEFENTAQFDGYHLDPITIEPTQPMTAPPLRSVPPRSTVPPVRTRPEVTVMPATPTVEAAPARSVVRRMLWAVVGVGGLVAVAATAWTLGSRQAAAVAAAPALGASQAAVATLPAPIATVAARPDPSTTTPAGNLHGKPRERVVRSADAPSTAAPHREELRTAEHVRAAPPVDETPRGHVGSELPAPAVATVGPRSPREACGARVFLALAVCMEEQCEKPRFKSHPQCDKVREIIERRHRGENGG